MMVEKDKGKFVEYSKSNASRYFSQLSTTIVNHVEPLMTFEDFAQEQDIFPESRLDWVKTEFYKMPKENDHPGYIYIYFSNED